MVISALGHTIWRALCQHPRPLRNLAIMCFGYLCLTDINHLMVVNEEGERCRNGCKGGQQCSVSQVMGLPLFGLPLFFMISWLPNNSCLEFCWGGMKGRWQLPCCEGSLLKMSLFHTNGGYLVFIGLLIPVDNVLSGGVIGNFLEEHHWC